ncbi:Nucleoid occlusion protein [subsurface metagenome]
MQLRYEEKFPLNLIDEADEEFQARLDYDEEELEGLRQDMAQNGQRNPVGLIQKGDRYQLIYGFQRVKAIRSLGWESVRANIYESASGKELYLQSFSDNIRHEDLSDLETALSLRFLKEQFNYSIEELAQTLGRKSVTVYNLLRLTTLEDEIKAAVHRGQISLTQAMEISRFPDFKRLKILDQTIKEQFSVRHLKALRDIKAKDVSEVKLSIPTGMAEILKDLAPDSQTKIMERLLTLGARPHNPQWYVNFGKGAGLDAVRWEKEHSYDPVYESYYKMFIKDVQPDVPKFGCEYSLTIAALKHNFTCPNRREWVVLAPKPLFPSDNPLHNRPAWFFWCRECIEETFPGVNFLEDYIWHPKGENENIGQHIIHKQYLERAEVK